MSPRRPAPFATKPRLIDRRAKRLRVVAATLVASLVGLGFTAQAAFDRGEPTVVAYASETRVAPIPTAATPYGASLPGMTGTTALPEEPADYLPTADPTLVAAPPFAFRGSSLDRVRALECLTTAIYYEAASEPDDGQAAVAQVILNRVRHPTFPNTVCGVIYQGSDRKGCQFSYACDGAMARKPSASAWDRARRAADLALSGRVFAPVGMATHYHTYAVTPYWNKSLVMTGVHGAHFFHRWKGYWGTPRAFSAVYTGGEPLPGPLGRRDVGNDVSDALSGRTAPLAAPVTLPSTVSAPVTDVAQLQPAYREATVAPNTLPQSTVLDKWADSGKPLR